MKSLSLRFNEQTIQFFFIEETNSFPILTKAIEFLKFRDPMVRTGAQSTILNIFRIDEPKARQYSLNESIMTDLTTEIVNQFEGHYNQTHSVCMEYLIYSLQPKMKDFTEGKMGLRLEYQIQSSLAGMEDWLMYLEDIFGLRIPSLSQTIIQNLFAQFIYPLVLAPLIKYRQQNLDSMKQSTEEESENDPRSHDREKNTDSHADEASMTLVISLFLLIQVGPTLSQSHCLPFS
jgi:hypothetical protein